MNRLKLLSQNKMVHGLPNIEFVEYACEVLYIANNIDIIFLLEDP